MENRKRVLMAASVASMLDQFNRENIKLLQQLGYEVDAACNFKKGNTCTSEKIRKLKKDFDKSGVEYFQIDFNRNIFQIHSLIRAYVQIKHLMDEREYTLLHCHSPIGGALTRICGKGRRCKIIYTAHGFHFYKGASLKNWLLYYPAEKYLSRVTDVLITINKEDYRRAKKKFQAGKTEYVPGVGIDIAKFRTPEESREEIRKKLGLKESDTVLLSVGELSKRKNQSYVLRELASLGDDRVKYIIAGIGPWEKKLKKQIRNYHLEHRVKLLGFQSEVENLYAASDIFVFPSRQEGLPVALMEAMAAGLPVLCSDIRGNRDLIENGKGGYRFRLTDGREFKANLSRLLDSEKIRKEMGRYNQETARQYDSLKINKRMHKIYRWILGAEQGTP